MQKNIKLLLSVILGLGILSRLLWFGSFPPGINWDEASLGYNAYSMFKTGADEWGTVLPTIFRAYGDYKLPGYIYLSVPFVAVSLSPITTRALSVVAGLVSILVFYLLLKKIFPKTLLPWLGTLAYVFIPWGWFLSHVAVEANLALFFVLTAVTAYLYKRHTSAIFLFGLAVWTYNANRIFVPLLLLFLVWHSRSHLKPKLLPILVLCAFFIPMLVQLVMPEGKARFRWTTLLDEGAIAKINEQSTLPGGRLLHNKATYLTTEFSKNYIAHFSPKFLFLKGGSQYQFNVPGTGLLPLILLPFFYLGFILLFFRKHSLASLLRFWLLAAPVASSLTRDAPHTLRSLSMLPIAVIITLIGLQYLLKKFRLSGWIYLVGVLICFIVYVYQLPTYQKDYSWAWQYGHSQVVSFIKANYQNYDEIIITKKYGEPHEFLLFYWPWDPASYRSDKNLVRYGKSDWFWVDSFDKFRFVNDWEMGAVTANLPAGKKYLIISSPDSPTVGAGAANINFLDDSPAFIIKAL